MTEQRRPTIDKPDPEINTLINLDSTSHRYALSRCRSSEYVPLWAVLKAGSLCRYALLCPGGGPADVRLASPPKQARAAELVDMHVEDEGAVSVISFYLYGLIGLSLLVVISPLIVFAVPLLVLL